MQNVFTNNIYLIYMYEEELALNKQQELTCRKNQPTNQSEEKKSRKKGKYFFKNGTSDSLILTKHVSAFIAN